MAAPTPAIWYRLTNAFTGPTLSLDIMNDGGQTSSGTLEHIVRRTGSNQAYRNPQPVRRIPLVSPGCRIVPGGSG